MSIEAMSLVLHHSEATGAAKLILLGVANHQGDSGAWPSVETLSKYARVTERRAQQLLRELEASGELVVEPQGGGWGQYRTNLYWVAVSCPEDCDGSANHKPGVKSGASGVRSRDSRGEDLSTSGVKPISPKPLREPREEPRSLVQNKFEHVDKDLFEEFWSIYPRRQARGNAIVAFAKALKTAPAKEILDGARQFAADPHLPMKQWIPMPATWLNQERWSDGPLPERELSPEEKAERAKAAAARRREADLEESRRRREESEAARRNMELNPPRRCEHDRVAVICSVCSRKKS